MKIVFEVIAGDFTRRLETTGSLKFFGEMTELAKKWNALDNGVTLGMTAEGYASPEEVQAFTHRHEVMMEREKTEKYLPEIRRILEALGHEEAFVTDLAKVGDLMAVGGSADDTMQADIDYAFGPLGLKGMITPDTLIVDAAAMLRVTHYPH